MKKLVEKLLSWCKKSMKMRRCVGKSTAPVTGQSVGQTGNAEGVLPSTATETVDEIVLPAAVETAGMAETIDEKATFGKSGRKKPENMLEALQCFLTARYNFRYNLLTEQTE
ncbi:helicase, partial [Phocaeicola vulgatus]